jgi:hypothetical protein
VAPWSSVGNSQGRQAWQEAWDFETTIVVGFIDFIDSG